jgi:adenylate cyclase
VDYTNDPGWWPTGWRGTATTRGLPALDVGVGLNTGEMIVGNMGSARRLSYTVSGDNVNLGARLEGLCKAYGCRIIASQQTAIEADADVVTREPDLVRVKGRAKPVRIYEVVAAASAAPTVTLRSNCNAFTSIPPCRACPDLTDAGC